MLATAQRPISPVAVQNGAPGWRRREDIQGLRGIAVLLVVLFHAGIYLPGGFTGVDVFFVISGFVIGGVLFAELEQTGRVDLKGFYVRRVRRLLPALALMVAVVVLAGVVLSPVAGSRDGGITGIFASVFSANIYLLRQGTGYFDSDQTLNPFLHTWTLGVEEQFYIFFPALLILSSVLALRGVRSSRRLRAGLLISLLALLSFVLCVWLSSGPPGEMVLHERFAFYALPTRAWEFGLGALLVLASPFLVRLPSIVGLLVGTLGLIAIVLAALAIQGTSGYPGIAALVPTAGACAVLAAGTIGARGVTQIIARRPLAWLGDLSYGWYLWHWPFIVFATALWPTQGVRVAAAAAALSLLPAWASHRYVERPIRANHALTGRSILVVGAVCVALPALACLSSLALSDALDSQPALAAWRASQEAHLDHQRGCDSGQPFGSQPRRCTWNVRNARGTIALVGDSYAGQLTEAVVRAGNLERFDVTVATFPSCPFVDVRVYGSVPSEAPCRRYYSRGLQALLRTRPSLVVTSFRADHYTEESQIQLAVGAHGRAADSVTAKEEALERGLASTLKRLNARGVPVLLVDPVPWYPTTIGSCATLRILSGSCPTTVSRRLEDRELADPMSIDREAVQGAHLTRRLNLEAHLCTTTRCSEFADGVVNYRNADHLSVEATTALTGVFAKTIKHLVTRNPADSQLARGD